MNNKKYLLCLIFIVFNINNAYANSDYKEGSKLTHAKICGQRTCETIFKEMRNFSKNGSSMAQATLAMMLTKGIGTEVDQDRSIKYIKKAANNGLPLAEYVLATLFRDGHVNGKFGRDADYWLMRAAKGNFKPAIDLLKSEVKIYIKDREIFTKEVNDYQPASLSTPSDKNIERISIIADRYTLSDLSDRLKSAGFGNVNQTGSRIKGRGCSQHSCKSVVFNSELGGFISHLYYGEQH